MKKILLTVLIACSLFACNNSRTINSTDLIGRYKMDTSGLAKQIENPDDSDFLNGLGKLFVLGVDVNFAFYDDNKGAIELSGWAMDLARSFSSDEETSPFIPFSYRIKNDSVLQLKVEDSGNYKTFGIIHRPTGTYDYVQIEQESGNLINLVKIAH